MKYRSDTIFGETLLLMRANKWYTIVDLQKEGIPYSINTNIRVLINNGFVTKRISNKKTKKNIFFTEYRLNPKYEIIKEKQGDELYIVLQEKPQKKSFFKQIFTRTS